MSVIKSRYCCCYILLLIKWQQGLMIHGLSIWTSFYQSHSGCSHCSMPNIILATEINTESLMWPFSPGMISQLLGKLITLDASIVEVVFFLSGIHTYSMYKSDFLHPLYLPKQPSMDLQDASSTAFTFHKTLLIIEELFQWQNKCSSCPIFMEFTGCAMFSTILKQLS